MVITSIRNITWCTFIMQIQSTAQLGVVVPTRAQTESRELHIEIVCSARNIMLVLLVIKGAFTWIW